jgi:phosphoglycolate phosphatase
MIGIAEPGVAAGPGNFLLSRDSVTDLLKLVAFDCDGVLFDSRRANTAYYNAILKQFQRPPLSPAAADFVHCHTVGQSLEFLFGDYPDLETVLAFARRLDYAPFFPLMVVESYLREFLEFLRPEFFTAVATNRTLTARQVFRHHGLAEYFDLVVSAQDVTHPKPHPESFWRILGHFGLAPEEALFIGDSRVDEEFAKNAGVALVAYRNPGLAADHYLESFAAGPALITALKGGSR